MDDTVNSNEENKLEINIDINTKMFNEYSYEIKHQEKIVLAAEERRANMIDFLAKEAEEQYHTQNREKIIELLKDTDCPTHKIKILEQAHADISKYNEDFKNAMCRRSFLRFNNLYSEVKPYLAKKRSFWIFKKSN
ncbi:hypothetical protein [Bacillus cereus group sp. MYBK139-2]|uniref:hypothetical protein n=1 Tax=unclassified Bacillus cereus group TaxID=2750818 RepID=UPI003F7A7E06